MEDKNVKWSDLPKINKFAVILFMVSVVFGLVVLISQCVDGLDNAPVHSEAYTALQAKIEKFSIDGVNEIDTPMFDYSYRIDNDSIYNFSSYFTYKNDFGVQKKVVYEASIKWLGGDSYNSENWELIYIDEQQ